MRLAAAMATRREKSPRSLEGSVSGNKLHFEWTNQNKLNDLKPGYLPKKTFYETIKCAG
jgi:hypothetical protein